MEIWQGKHEGTHEGQVFGFQCRLLSFLPLNSFGVLQGSQTNSIKTDPLMTVELPHDEPGGEHSSPLRRSHSQVITAVLSDLAIKYCNDRSRLCHRGGVHR